MNMTFHSMLELEGMMAVLMAVGYLVYRRGIVTEAKPCEPMHRFHHPMQYYSGILQRTGDRNARSAGAHFFHIGYCPSVLCSGRQVSVWAISESEAFRIAVCHCLFERGVHGQRRR